MIESNLYDELSRRMFGFSRNLIKGTMHLMSYNGTVDPWLANIIGHELSAIRKEQQCGSTISSPSARS